MNDLAPRRPVPATKEGAEPSGGFVLALALLVAAGWVDALGYVQWHGLFVSFMSGNTTAFGAATVAHDGVAAIEAGRAVLIFVVGVIVGELLRAATGRWDRSVVLGAETLLLGLAYAAALKHWGEAATATITGLAMGVQTAAVHKAASLTVSLTYVTGTLVNIGRSLVKALFGEAPWRDAFSYLGLWCALFVGSAGGAIVAAISTPLALFVAASLLAGFSAVAISTAWMQPAPVSGNSVD